VSSKKFYTEALFAIRSMNLHQDTAGVIKEDGMTQSAVKIFFIEVLFVLRIKFETKFLDEQLFGPVMYYFIYYCSIYLAWKRHHQAIILLQGASYSHQGVFIPGPCPAGNTIINIVM
jgi:hypothetical protein